MKRRTNPAISRPARPASSSFPPSGLEDAFPGLDSMSDIEGCQILFSLYQLASDADSSMAYQCLAHFADCRGLQICESGRGFKGFSVFLLQRKDSGEIVASFSSEFR